MLIGYAGLFTVYPYKQYVYKLFVIIVSGAVIVCVCVVGKYVLARNGQLGVFSVKPFSKLNLADL